MNPNDQEILRNELIKAIDEGVLTDEQVRALELKARGELAGHTNDLKAYGHFHFCVFGRELPKHAIPWIEAYFEEWNKPSKEGMRGVMNKAARGLAKSTETLGFVLFQMGHNPHLSTLIVQDTDDNAKKWAKFVADTIESNVGWKASFPYVVPDKDRGWSENGYHIKDTRTPYEEWVKKVSDDHKRDPSFVAVSVVSGSVGMHPTGFLVLDDIHTEKNTSSETEMSAIVKKVKADIIPTMTNPGHKPCLLVAYTPWRKNDTYAELEHTGVFTKLLTTAFVIDETSGLEFEGEKIKLTWPKAYSVKVLEQQKRILGKREFARQVLCDLEQASSQSLPYYGFPSGQVKNDWVMVGGVDPTSVVKELEGKKRSYFAHAHVAKLPLGGAVVAGGTLEQCSLAEAESRLAQAQTMYPRWTHSRCENVGVGSVFIQTIRTHAPHIRIVASDLSGITSRKVRSKEDRLLSMAVWFENGTVRISDGDTPFLNALRKLFDNFFDLDKNDPAWDAGDSVYHALKGIPEVLRTPSGEELPSALPVKRENIFAGLKGHRG